MRLVEQLYKVIAPSDCLSCGAEGSLLCNWCAVDSLIEHDSRCYKCNQLVQDFAVCATCRRKSRLKCVFIRSEYTDLSKELVHRMKFSYSNEAADIIADQMVSKLPVFDKNTLVVSVPTVTSHTRQRGFDHSKRLATNISRLKKLEYCPALTRTNQARQVGASRKQRLVQQQDAFRLKRGYSVTDKTIILVDDVITTGATLESAAQTLKQAGAKSIYAAVFARSVH